MKVVLYLNPLISESDIFEMADVLESGMLARGRWLRRVWALMLLRDPALPWPDA